MKNSIFYSIQPLDYDLLKREFAGSDEAKAILERLIQDHQALLEIRERIVRMQAEIAGGIFAYGKGQITPENSESAVPTRSEDVEDDFSPDGDLPTANPDAHPLQEPTDGKKKLRGKKALPLGIVKLHALKDSDKVCSTCATTMVMTEVKSKTIVFSQPLFATETHKTESCRCLNCNSIHDAETPAEVHQTIGRYHFGAVAQLVALRYLYGMASYRLETYSQNVGLRITDSTQWSLFEGAASQVLRFATFLEKTAANAPTSHTDDTHALVLSIAKQIEDEQNAALQNGKKPDTVRSGLHTTNLTAVFDEGEIVLFRTGLHHAGEVLARILSARTVEESVVIIADASSANTSKLPEVKAKTKIANCNGHALRKFKELADAEKEFARKNGILNPEPNAKLDSILKKYRTVFENDKKTRKMNSADRLRFHKQNSMPVMQSILEFIESDFRLKKVEPNSELGKIYSYFKNHFAALTVFCEVEGAPVDNNLSERMLKGIIRQRKNSLFYKNQLGARVADILTSILMTAQANGLNPIEYLTHLMVYQKSWMANPSEWLPWNYKTTIAALTQNLP